MKTMKFTKQVFSLLFIASLLFACSKDDGEDGATGPAGPQGEQGVAGADGEDGADGADGADGEQGSTGTANVIYSEWIDTQFDDNIILVGAGFDISVSQLTQENINEAAILVFGRNVLAFGPPVVFPLPFISGSNQYSFRIEEVGTLRITVNSLDNTSVGTPFFEDYRYIIIPGGNTAEGPEGPGGIGSKKANIDFDKMSYEEVIAHFNISE